MDTSNRENEEIRVLDSESPRSSTRNTDIVPDIVRKLLAEVSNIRDENKQLRKEMEGLKAKRKTKLGKNISFDGSSYQALTKKLLTEVRAVYGKKKWRKSTIKAAVHQHWRSIRDDKTKKANNSFEKHRRRIMRSNRLKRVYKARLNFLDNSTVLSDGDKKRAREILSSPEALHYMSSEESCEEEAVETGGDPTPRKVRKLSWERSQLRNIKVKLDKAYFAALTEKQCRTTARVNPTVNESSRPHPTNGPRWAVRSD
ncbi:uncharacterized protein LOC111330449 [Stylophora pistillata]|uniref:uncharacterized protein LOC111330449 n=1 Tax=Stylophora pistillata TaxID=50429 RepID=UPI000C03F877|nr:uncharacterized protein LOC111330449 [Stylophora pistillata]